MEGVAKDNAAGRSIVYEFRISRKDGSKRWVEARIVPLDYQDERWVLGNLVDITNRKEDEKDLLMDKRRLLVLYSLVMKAVDFRGEVDDLMKEALSELMAGLDGFEVGGVFLLEKGRLVLRALAGPLEDIMSFVNQTDAEELLMATESKIVVESDRPVFWASTPFCNGEELRGLLVLGREKVIEQDFLRFLKDLAWHVGKMVEIFELSKIHLREGLNED